MDGARLGSVRFFAPEALFFCRVPSSARPVERADQNRFLGQIAAPFPAELFLRPDEGEQIGIDLVGVRGGHPVRQAGIGFQSSVLQELD